MTIEEIREEKQKVADEISKIIGEFQKKTNCEVKAINVDSIYQDWSRLPVATQIDIRLESL